MKRRIARGRREDRIREMDDQYRDGTSLIDERRYERAIDRFDRVIERKVAARRWRLLLEGVRAEQAGQAR